VVAAHEYHFCCAIVYAASNENWQATNIQASDYFNVVHPDNAAKYQLRLQLQLMIPKQASSSTGDVIA